MKNPVFIGLLLIFLILAVLAQVVYHDFFVIDDLSYIRNNPQIQSGINAASLRWAFTADLTHDSPGTDYWQPVTHLSRMLDMQIFGLKPGGHHATNLLIHILNSLLLFGILLAVTAEIWPSALVAALFAVHPFQVETVAWATARKDLLATFFGLLSMGAYVRYARKRSSLAFFLSVILFALSLMSKPMLVTMPFVFLLLDFWPLRRIGGTGVTVIPAAPTAAQSSGAKAGIQKLGPRGSGGDISLLFEKIPYLILALLAVFIVKNAPSLSFYAIPPQHILRTIPSAYVWYLENTVFPRNLCLRSPEFSTLVPLWHFGGSLLLLAAISFFALRRTLKRPYLAFGWLWFLTTLSPMTSLIPVGDRFMYFPIIGLAVMTAWGVPELLQSGKILRSGFSPPFRVAQDDTHRHPEARSAEGSTGHIGSPPIEAPGNDRLNIFLAVTSILVFALLSSIQTSKWRDSFAFLNHMISSQNKNFLAEYNLGVLYARNGYFEDAIEHYKNTLDITPGRAFVHDNIGLAYFRMGRLEEARKAFEAAVSLDPSFEGARLHLKELEK